MHNSPSFHGKTALITGGSSGIGFSLARVLAEEGVKLALIGSDQGRLDRAVESLRLAGADAAGFRLDVTNLPGWGNTILSVEQTYGPIDLLILNAGAATRGKRSIEDMSVDEWHWVWNVNVNGVFYGLKTCLPRMKAREEGGHILITGSLAALVTRPQSSSYSASKAAVLTLGETVRQELANTPIHISVLCPGFVNTDFAGSCRRHSPQSVTDDTAWIEAVLANGQDPMNVARYTVARMRKGDFYIFSHPELRDEATKTMNERIAALLAQ